MAETAAARKLDGFIFSLVTVEYNMLVSLPFSAFAGAGGPAQAATLAKIGHVVRSSQL